MAEETLYDSEAMRRFAGIELGDDRIPDETTILNFRHLLERHGLTQAIFAEVNAHLVDKGITLRGGTLIDATIIDAPPSTKNKARARDPEMSSTKKGGDWYFGMKAHIGVDAASGVTHSLETTTAKVHDSQIWDALLHGKETSVWAELPLERHWSERQWRRLCQRRARGRVHGCGQGLGRDAQGPKGRRIGPPRRGGQPRHCFGQGTRRASVPRHQAPIRPCEGPLARPCQKPRPPLHAARAW